MQRRWLNISATLFIAVHFVMTIACIGFFVGAMAYLRQPDPYSELRICAYRAIWILAFPLGYLGVLLAALVSLIPGGSVFSPLIFFMGLFANSFLWGVGFKSMFEGRLDSRFRHEEIPKKISSPDK